MSTLAVRLRNAAFKAVLRAPEPLLVKLAGGPDRKDGMLLDPHIGALIAGAKLAKIQDRPDVKSSREYLDNETQAVSPEPIAMAVERDLWVSGQKGDIRARVYTPKTARPGAGMLVFYHGGGFVAGSLFSHDRAIRELAQLARVHVLSVDYSLAPEHKFPAAIEDGFAAYQWARAHASELGADSKRVGVGGDSAGGNLAAVVTHFAKARSAQQPTVQLLIYPATEMTCSMGSHKTFASGYLLDEDRVHWYRDHYLENAAQRTDPRASPLYYERFEELAPAIVVTAGFDVLRDEGEAYATKLQDAGVAVNYTCERGLIHGFFNMSGVIPAARRANITMSRALAKYLA